MLDEARCATPNEDSIRVEDGEAIHPALRQRPVLNTTVRVVLGTLLATGVGLRLWLLTHRPYLWLDEAHLAPNVINRDWSSLFTPAINEQMAPFGWLALTKFATSLIWLPQETCLRLPAAFCGIAALFAVVALARKLRVGAVEQLSVAAFAAFSPAWIYYSAEFKQYSTELLCTLVMTFAAAKALRSARLKDRWFLYGAGVVAVLLALSAPLTLGALGGYIILRDAFARRWRALICLSSAAAVWVVLFALHLHFLSDPKTSAKMSGTWWLDGFAPWSASLPAWFGHAALNYSAFVSGVEPTAGLFLCLFAAGLFALSRKADGHAAWLCSLPALAALVASTLHVYPFEGRLLLFASGGIVIAVGAGVGVFTRALLQRWPTTAVAVMLLPGLVPVALSGSRQSLAQHDDPLPHLIKFVASERRPNELVYVQALALPVWRVYARRYAALDPRRGAIIAGRDSRVGLSYYLADLQALQGRGRVWMLFSRASGLEQDDLSLGEYIAKLRGRVLQRKREGSAEALLVDFSYAGPADLAPARLKPYQPIHSAYRLEL